MIHQKPVVIFHHSPFEKMLLTLLAMHEDEKELSDDFVQANGDVLLQIYSKQLGSYSIKKMITGRFRFRRVHPGLLTPPGIVAAKALQHSA